MFLEMKIRRKYLKAEQHGAIGGEFNGFVIYTPCLFTFLWWFRLLLMLTPRESVILFVPQPNSMTFGGDMLTISVFVTLGYL